MQNYPIEKLLALPNVVMGRFMLIIGYKKEKEAAEKLKMEELQSSIKSEVGNQTLDELKRMDLSTETVRKVEQDLEAAAKAEVTEIQGQYYETYD